MGESEKSAAVCLLPGACSEGCCQSCENPPEEGVWVLPCNDKVDSGQHKKAMNGMSDDTAGYVFSQTGKQSANILHLNDLASYKEHDTKRGIPVERQGVQERERTVQYCRSLWFWNIAQSLSHSMIKHI